MPYYKVTCKTNADDDGDTRSLGQMPDANAALAVLNNTYAREKSIGPFMFVVKIGSHVPDYYLVEQQQLNGPEVRLPLCTTRGAPSR